MHSSRVSASVGGRSPDNVRSFRLNSSGSRRASPSSFQVFSSSKNLRQVVVLPIPYSPSSAKIDGPPSSAAHRCSASITNTPRSLEAGSSPSLEDPPYARASRRNSSSDSRSIVFARGSNSAGDGRHFWRAGASSRSDGPPGGASLPAGRPAQAPCAPISQHYARRVSGFPPFSSSCGRRPNRRSPSPTPTELRAAAPPRRCRSFPFRSESPGSRRRSGAPLDLVVH